MIKIRLHGTKDEIDNALAQLKMLPSIKILSESEPYADDRGNSAYSRVYVDAEVAQLDRDKVHVSIVARDCVINNTYDAIMYATVTHSTHYISVGYGGYACATDYLMMLDALTDKFIERNGGLNEKK